MVDIALLARKDLYKEGTLDTKWMLDHQFGL